MGARGFAKHLARHRVGRIRGKLSDFAGQEFVIDGLNCIYGLARKHRMNVPFHFDALCAALYDNQIRATVVFDGPADRMRAQVQRARSRQRVARQNRLAWLQSRKLTTQTDVARLEWQLATPDQGDVGISRTIAEDYGFSVVDAAGEADLTCAVLSAAKSGVVISSDTDLIAYRTPTVIHDVQVKDGTFNGWSQEKVLKMLGLSARELQEVFAVMNDPAIQQHLNISDVIFDAGRGESSLLTRYERLFGPLEVARSALANYQSIQSTS